MTEIEKLVLSKLRKGPLYARSFYACKPVIARLIAKGLVVRVAPDGLKTKNMLALAGDSHDQ